MEKSIIQKTKQLTNKQAQIVDSNEYPIYLRAGAGTGKTEVLVQKILHILKNEPNVSLMNFANGLEDFDLDTFRQNVLDLYNYRNFEQTLTDSLNGDNVDLT